MFERDLIFPGAHSTGWLLFWLASLSAAAALMVMLMRYERRLVPANVGWGLLALRLAVLCVLLFTFLQPVVSWSIDREKTGRVLVAVDLSESMATVDAHATKAEKLRWARALGMIGNSAIDSRLDRWMTEFDAGREPTWVDPGESADEQKRRQLEEARRENLDGVFAEIDRLSRKEIARRLLEKGAEPLLAELEKQGNVEIALFGGRAEMADPATLEKSVEEPPKSVITEASDLAAAMGATPASAETSPLLGIVLFTDGRDNAGRDPIGLASRLGQLEAPIFPVLLGSKLRPKDLAIASVDFPQTVFKDDKPVLKATLSTPGFEGDDLTVVLERKGQEPVSKTVRPGGKSVAVEFDLDGTKVGRQEYTLRTDVRPGETRDDNNSRSFAMTVVDDKVRVLLIEGEARWEFRFIETALSRDERVVLNKVVYRQPYMGVLNDTFFPRTLPMPANANNLQASPFAEPDLVILGDVAPFDLPPEGWDLLEKYVSEGGGTLVMIAGKQFFPLGFQGNQAIERLIPMTNLKVVDLSGAAGQGSPGERGFHLQLTPDGEREAMLQFDPDPLENRKAWQGLPGHVWGLFGEPKPGATVYAWAKQPGGAEGLEAERRGAVIVQQPYGFGQVLWMGVDSTWRWRHRVGDRFHHRYWGQMGRWAAENKATAGNEHVKFGPDRPDVQLGEDVMLRARWSQPFLKKFPQLKARVEIARQDAAEGEKPFAVVELKPVEGRPLVFEGRALALPAGQYKLKLVTEGADLGPNPVTTSLFVNQPTTLELSDLSANRELLQQLADVSHGRLFLPDQLSELPPLLRHRDLHSTHREDVELWDHWLVLLLFFGLLTAEWVTRKLNGLP